MLQRGKKEAQQMKEQKIQTEKKRTLTKNAPDIPIHSHFRFFSGSQCAAHFERYSSNQYTTKVNSPIVGFGAKEQKMN